MQNKEPNRLIHSSSPYLLQHAYNPVDWYPWGKEALEKSKKEDKAIIVSIGYSACHWCHVMEHESFENRTVADFMNTHFVCIKVDREERPDIDAIYMDAIQAMGQRGGWPLNAFLTPDTKPFYALTYLPPQNWLELLQNVATVFKQKRSEVNESAQNFSDSIQRSDVEKFGLTEITKDFKKEDLELMFKSLAQNFDTELGGMNRAPKFPMPAIYQFLLHYYAQTENKKALTQLNLTLEEMAKGGIYDQIGGGFARYSVDSEWLVPHFEKMLYDNAQLVSLYADAYNLTKNKMYKNVVYQTIEFLEREMMNEEFAFFSALDADSEGEEGRFYVWFEEEIEQILGEEADLCKKYYQIIPEGNWEEGKNILHLRESDENFAQNHKITLEDLNTKIQSWQNKLMEVRSQKIRPGLDDKILCSWNGLILKGLADVYRVFGENKFLDLAQKNADFILSKMKNGNKLWHTYKNGKASIEAYLEDYASVIQGLIALYQVSFEIKYLEEARNFAEYCIESFYDTKEEMFFFTDQDAEELIARKKEIFDNVIPSSNSMMAQNLFWLGILFDNQKYSELSKKMLGKMSKLLQQDIGFLANWGVLYALQANEIAEIILVGEDYKEFSQEINQSYIPYKVLLGSQEPNKNLPLFESRVLKDNQTTIYVCYNKTCQLPVTSVQEALKQI